MDEKQLVEAIPKELFLAGQWRESHARQRLAVDNPATGKVLCEVSDADAQDAQAALDEAVDVQNDWAATPPRKRSDVLRGAFELLLERQEQFALLMTLEMGKSLTEARAEVAYGAEFFRWFSEEAVRIAGRWSTAPDGGGHLLTMKQPVGPCLLITPWNFPLAMGTRKIGPAIAAGCTMIWKPAAATPLTSLALAQVLQEAGLPDGVLSVLPSSDAQGLTQNLMRDVRLRKLSFTGSTQVGKQLMESSARNLLRLSMELGGNAPFLVFEDADVDAAVDGAVVAKMRNIGQSCVAANRFYVAEKIQSEFVEKLTERLQSLKMGRGTEENNEVGPLISETQRQKVDELAHDAIERGAIAHCGGRLPDGPGYFYPPTLLSDIPSNARLLREEIFGPVVAIRTFVEEQQAIDQANDTEYGLVAYFFTRDSARVMRVMERLQVGMVGINQGIVSNPAAPFGGVKHSGFGREGGLEGIEEYLDTKYCAFKI